MAPTTAIVTRTHNRLPLLKRALHAVSSQTSQDYVHVIVNDAGDREDLEALLSELPEEQRKRQTVIHNQVSAGREAAVNPGFVKAQELGAKYVVVLDDDDTWEPEFLAKTVAWLEAHPQHVGVGVGVTVIYETISEENVITKLRHEALASDKSYVSLEDILQVNFVPPVSLLFRVSVLETLRGWREDLPVLADWEFFLRMLLLGEVGYITQPLANWHRREDATGDLGNSVVVEAENHHDFHALIRDEYLRQELNGSCGSLAGSHLSGSENGGASFQLGMALLLAHYAKELREQLERNQHHTYIESVATRDCVAALNAPLHDLSVKVDALQQQLTSMGWRARLRRLLHLG